MSFSIVLPPHVRAKIDHDKLQTLLGRAEATRHASLAAEEDVRLACEHSQGTEMMLWDSVDLRTRELYPRPAILADYALSQSEREIERWGPSLAPLVDEVRYARAAVEHARLQAAAARQAHEPAARLAGRLLDYVRSL